MKGETSSGNLKEVQLSSTPAFKIGKEQVSEEKRRREERGEERRRRQGRKLDKERREEKKEARKLGCEEMKEK